MDLMAEKFAGRELHRDTFKTLFSRESPKAPNVFVKYCIWLRFPNIVHLAKIRFLKNKNVFDNVHCVCMFLVFISFTAVFDYHNNNIFRSNSMRGLKNDLHWISNYFRTYNTLNLNYESVVVYLLIIRTFMFSLIGNWNNLNANTLILMFLF